eukprot:3960439-Pyramimonas_sp.AAC.1
MLLEHKPDAMKQDSPSQKSSRTISWEPQEVLRTLFGGAMATPGRLATAWQLADPQHLPPLGRRR